MKLNDFEFSGDYVITNIQHDSGTPQNLNTLDLSRRDGTKLISANFDVKEVSISGIIKSTTIEGLETNLDTFKKAVMVTNGNLDMDYAGETRRYIVDCKTCTISREYYNVTFAPFEVKFQVSDPPFAKSISSLGGGLTMVEAFSSDDLTQESIQDSFSVSGSAIPKVKIKYRFDAIGDIGSVDFINLSTSKQLNISTAFTSGDELLIDHDNLNVTLNGEPVEFEGVFPDLKLGSNSFESNMYLVSGTTLDASQTINNSFKPLYGNIKLAQSFTISASALIPKIQLLLRKTGSITSDITLTVQTNSGSAPSGTIVTNGTYTISAASVGSSAFWINIPCTDLELSSATTYWVVLSTTNGSPEDYYEWRGSNAGGYANGNAARFFNSWNTLGSDYCFKIYKNIVDVSNTNEAQESFIESFSGSTYEDFGTVVDSYAESNQSSYVLSAANLEGGPVYQSFTGDGNKLSSVRFYLKRVGTPGNHYAYLYAHSGTFGTSSVPTGAAVATSYIRSCNSVSTTAYELVEFIFDGSYTLVNGTKYCIAISASNDSSNGVYVGLDNTSSGHGGNSGYQDTGSWTAESTKDLCFYVNTNDVTEVFWDSTNSKALLPLSAETVDLSHTGNVSDFNFGTTGYAYLDQEIVPAADGVLSKVSYYLKKIGSPAGSVTAEIWTTTLSSGSYNANTLLASSTTSTAPASISTSYGTYSFLFDNPAISSGTHYILRIKVTSGADDSNCYSLRTGYDDFFTAWSVYLFYNNSFVYNNTSAFYMSQYYKIYITTSNIIQSTAVDSYSSVIASATLSKTDVTLNGTSIAYSLSSDGTNFESVTNAVEKYFTNIGSSLKFKGDLTGTVQYSPYIDSLTISYKLAGLISDTTHRIAQSFVSGFSGNLGRVKINLKKFGSPGNLTVAIYSDSGGSPNSLLATQEFTGTVLDTQFGWTSINFTSPATLTATTTYWIVISAAATLNSTNGYLIRTKPINSYANGTLKYSTNSGGAYSEYTNEDILMQVYPSSGLQHQFDMEITYNPRYL